MNYFRLLFILVLQIAMIVTLWASTSLNPTGEVSLDQIVQLVKTQNLEVKAAQKNREAKDALARYAGVLPNPDFGMGLETSSEQGSLSEMSVKVGTLVERGGKRDHRKEVSRLAKRVADLNYLSILSSRTSDAGKLRIDILTKQDILELHNDKVSINKDFLNEIKVMVEKGRLNIVEQKRATILLSQSQLELSKRSQELKDAKNQLSMLWGFPMAVFDRLTGDIKTLKTRKELEILKDQVENGLQIQRNTIELELANAEVSLELGYGETDMTIEGSVKQALGNGQQAIEISAGIPLGIFDRNQGAIEASKKQVDQATLALKQALIKAEQTLESLYSQLIVLETEITTLKTDIIPQSQEVYDQLQQGYLKGKYSYLAVLEAQDQMFEFRESCLEASAKHLQILLDIDSVIGTLIKGESYE